MREVSLIHSKRLEVARERFWKSLLDGHHDMTEEDIQCRMRNLGIQHWGNATVVVMISLHLDMYPSQQIDHALLKIEETVIRYFKDFGWTVNGYMDSRNCMMVILNDDHEKKMFALDEAVARLIKKLMIEYGIVIYAGIGGKISALTDIQHSAMDANRCIEYKYSVVKENVINIKDVNQLVSRKNTDNSTAFERVIGCFLDGNLQKLTVRLNELLQFLKNAQSSLQTIKHVYLELMTLIFRRMTDAGIKLEEETTKEHVQFILNEENPQRIKEWFISCCADFIYEMGKKRTESSAQISQQAKAYVKENYSDPDLSQQSVSDHLGLSVGYFGQLFFAQTGQKFTDYLHEYRLETAVTLLRNSNEKIKDISRAVGFSNANYFNSVFKKMYAMTPREYREQNTDAIKSGT